MKVLAVFGTRPEAIKMCPLVLEMKERKGIDCRVCLTGQHKEMLDQVMEAFQVREDYNLDVMRPQQTLTTITGDILTRLETVLQQENPDVVLVHGDTTTSFASALAAFYQRIPVGHVEAGLRTGNRYSPYPEEMNRLLTGRLAKFHFAPTIRNRENLRRENITEHVYVTGNTVIDAFQTTVQKNYSFQNEQLRQIDFKSNRVILVTAHRRENLGRPLENICEAVAELVKQYRDCLVICPVHLNPAVQETIYIRLGGQKRILLTQPLNVLDMHNLIARSYLVLTDSGGLQEEAPACGKPVLVMRTETERPEAVEAGTVKVVGVEKNDIVREAARLLENPAIYTEMAHAVNPYGDGQASRRICDILEKHF